MVTHGTNLRCAAEIYGYPLHESIVHGGANVHPLRQFVVCGGLTLYFLLDSNRCGRWEAELVSCDESIFSLRKNRQS